MRGPAREKTLPFQDAEGAAAVAQEQVREFETLAEEGQFAELAEEFRNSPEEPPPRLSEADQS